MTDEDWIGLMIFKNFADQDWIGFNFIGSGLDSDWNISQSAHLWYMQQFYVLLHLQQKDIRKTLYYNRFVFSVTCHIFKN